MAHTLTLLKHESGYDVGRLNHRNHFAQSRDTRYNCVSDWLDARSEKCWQRKPCLELSAQLSREKGGVLPIP